MRSERHSVQTGTPTFSNRPNVPPEFRRQEGEQGHVACGNRVRAVLNGRRTTRTNAMAEPYNLVRVCKGWANEQVWGWGV